MKTTTTEGMPPGYILIRWGFLQWGWSHTDPEEGYYQTDFLRFTATAARKHAWRHYSILKWDGSQEHTPKHLRS